MNGSIHTNSTAALLGSAHNDGAGTGYQKFTIGNGSIASGQVNGIAELGVPSISIAINF